MTAFKAMFLTLWKSQLRDPVGLFFSFAFPPALVLILGIVLGNEPRSEFDDRGMIDATLPAFTSLVLAMIGVLQLPVNLLTLQETGALRRLKLTPLSPTTFVAANLAVQFLIGFAGMAAALAVGVLIFGVDLPATLPGVLLACAFGLVVFLALGFALARLYPSVGAATGIGNVLMIVLMISSGAFTPPSAMPDGVRRAIEFSPVRQFVQLITEIWDGDAISSMSTPLIVLTAMLVMCVALSWRFFRWESPR